MEVIWEHFEFALMGRCYGNDLVTKVTGGYPQLHHSLQERHIRLEELLTTFNKALKVQQSTAKIQNVYHQERLACRAIQSRNHGVLLLKMGHSLS